MMGHQSDGQKPLFYAFNLEDHVPANHLLRGIDRFHDLSQLRQHLAGFNSHTGRPSIDPELMIRMLLIGYCFGIRSERRLCEEVHLNLAYRWFCRLGLEGGVLDHSSFSQNRHGRFRESDALRRLFETVLERCMAEGLVRGEGFAIDASVIKADANRERGPAGDEAIDWKAPGRSTRAVREYLTALDQDGPPMTTRASISLTDPAARWTCAPGGPAFYAYSTNYLIDLKAGIIVDVEATPAARRDEIVATRPYRGPIRIETSTAGWRYRLRQRRDAGLAGGRQADCTACAGIRQVRTRRRYLWALNVHVRCEEQPVRLSGRQASQTSVAS